MLVQTIHCHIVSFLSSLRPQVLAMHADMGFGVFRNAAAMDIGVVTLRWRMKLAFFYVMLLKSDMLQLDKPANHLDQLAVK